MTMITAHRVNQHEFLTPVRLNEDVKAAQETSIALWIPIFLMLLINSRPVTEWSASRTQDWISSTQFSEGSPVNALIFGCLIASALVLLYRRRGTVLAFMRANGHVLLFLTFCLASILWSDHTLITIKRWIKEAGEFLVLAIVLTDRRPQAAVRRFLITPVFLLLPLSVILIVLFPHLGTYTGVNNGQVVTYYGGVTLHKNMLGVSCLVQGLACLWFWLDAYADRTGVHRVRNLIIYGILYSTAVGLILRANSMTPLVTLLVASAFIVIGRRHLFVLPRGYLHLLIAILVIAPLIIIWLDTSGVMASLLGRQASLSGRTEIWNAVLSIDINPVVGAGFETFWLGDRLDKVWMLLGQGGERGIQEAHNGYIELYLNLGWMGLIFLGYVLWIGYRSAINGIRTEEGDSVIRLAFIVAALIYAMAEAGFRMMGPAWILFLMGVIQVPRSQSSMGIEFRPILPGKTQTRRRILH